MAIPPFKPGSLVARRTGNLYAGLRADLTDLQRQLATGKKSDTYGGLGFDRRRSLNLRARLETLEGFQNTIQDANLRLSLLDLSLERTDKLVQDTRGALLPGGFERGTDGRTTGQKLAEEAFKETVDLLNVDINGRFLFSGRTSDIRPVETFTTIIDGDGTRAGLKQLIAERKQADLGTGGLGRLAATSGGTNVQLAEEAAGLPFGFRIAGASAEGTGIVATYAAGPPAVAGLNVASQPADGDKVRVELTLPDGTRQTVELVARTAANAPSPENAFVIGPTPADTAANLAAALTSAVGKEAATTLAAASAQAAAKDFFNGSVSNPPLRVAGPPFDTATTTVAGTAANTVIWYKGDDSAGSARSTAPVRLDATQTVGLGAQANEEGLRTALAGFGVLAAETFPASDPNARARYEALSERVRTTLGFPGNAQSVQDILTELATAQVTIDGARQRHKATSALLQGNLDTVENAPPEEVAAAILSLQTRLQASYETTSILSRLSLVNYL